MSHWRFTGLEFDILWSAFGHDRLPYPLRFRPIADDFDDLREQRAEAVGILLDKYFSPELVQVLGTLREPEVRVELKGFGNTDMARTYRFHGAMSGSAGATLVQLPGVDDDTGGDVIVANCAAGHVPAQAVAALPPVSAGKLEPLEVRREQLGANGNRSLRTLDGASLVHPVTRMFERPRHSMGEIRMFPGSAVDARPCFSRGFWWMDYDDGRYYVRTGDPIVAKPLSAKAMTSEITRLARLTRRFYREDREHDEYLRTGR